MELAFDFFSLSSKRVLHQHHPPIHDESLSFFFSPARMILQKVVGFRTMIFIYSSLIFVFNRNEYQHGLSSFFVASRLKTEKKDCLFLFNISILFSRWFREEVNSPMDALRKKNIIFTLNIIYLMVFLCDVRLCLTTKRKKLEIESTQKNVIVCGLLT